ncbi:MAG TPA: twin-arginine translocase TatA/TatE family subunit [Tepidisphaeraceae bacterium]|nr:twin-arginine translocase TatA/TatE family subunit [Tepidisphaeraceae bacterium]
MLTTTLPLALGMPGTTEWIFIAAIALLIFGKRLPEVGRSMGRGIVEFKKGLAGVEDDVKVGMVDAPSRPALHEGDAKFDPYTGKPLKAESTSTQS